MLLLLESLRILLRLVLAPLVWLVRWIGIFYVIAAVAMPFIDAVPHRLLWAVASLLFGVVLIALANLTDNLDLAVSRWIYFRQQYAVARKIPGKPIRRAFGRYLDGDTVVETAAHPARARDLD